MCQSRAVIKLLWELQFYLEPMGSHVKAEAEGKKLD